MYSAFVIIGSPGVALKGLLSCCFHELCVQELLNALPEHFLPFAVVFYCVIFICSMDRYSSLYFMKQVMLAVLMAGTWMTCMWTKCLTSPVAMTTLCLKKKTSYNGFEP